MLEADAFDLREAEEEDAVEGLRLGGGRRGTIRSVSDLAHLTVPQLKMELRARQIPTTGTKPSLLRRLVEALNDEDAAERSNPPS